MPVSLLNVSDWQATAAAASDPPCAHLLSTSCFQHPATHAACTLNRLLAAERCPMSHQTENNPATSACDESSWRLTLSVLQLAQP